MKYLPKTALIVCACLLLCTSFSRITPHAVSPLNGAWKIITGTVEELLLVADGYCMVTTYDKQNKRFYNTLGGPFTATKDKISVKIHFNSEDKNEVGKSYDVIYSLSGNTLNTNVEGNSQSWKRLDEGKKNLAGNWRITQRKVDGKMNDMPLRSRRTLKLLTETHFQWAAINIETGEFSGTGGGRYTFENGKYTEHIEFFSRDNSRVGAALTFDGKLENSNWIHSGLSSKGDPIYEVWSRFKE